MKKKILFVAALISCLNICAHADDIKNMATFNTGKTFKDLEDATLLGGIKGKWLVDKYNEGGGKFDPFVWFPSYQWSFGCTPTSYSMVVGYWSIYYGLDVGFGNIPTENLTGAWKPSEGDIIYKPEERELADGTILRGERNGNCPIAASRKGLAGLNGNGHVEQFWAHTTAEGKVVDKDFSSGDVGRTEGVGGFFQKKDCLADWMQTSLGSGIGKNGGTSITSPSPQGLVKKNVKYGAWGLFEYMKRENGEKIYVTSQRTDYTEYTNDDIIYMLGHMGYTTQANKQLAQVKSSDGASFSKIKTSIDNGIPVIISVVLTLPKNYWGEIKRKSHTMVVIGYWGDGDLYVRSTYEWDEMKRFSKYKLGSKISTINYKQGTGKKGDLVRWLIQQATFFDSENIKREHYTRIAHPKEGLPRSMSETRLTEDIIVLNPSQKNVLDISVDNAMFFPNDSIECKVLARCHDGDPVVLYESNTMLSVDKRVTITTDSYDMSPLKNKWLLASDPKFVDGMILISKTDSDSLARKRFYRRKLYFDHGIASTAPEIDIKVEKFDVGDSLEAVSVSIVNTGGPIRKHSLGTMWSFGDGYESIVPNAYHIYDKAGTYAIDLKVTAIDGTEYKTSRSVFISKGITTILDNKLNTLSKNSIAVNNATLSINMEHKGNLSVDVYNMLGRVVNTVDYGTMTKGLHTVDFSKDGNLAAGAYLLKITAGEEVLNTKALIY